MYNLIAIFLVLFHLTATAQKDIQLFTKEVDSTTIICATNVSKTDYEITLKIESNGVELSKPMPLSQLLKAGATEELVVLTPRPGQAWSYNTSLSFKPVQNLEEIFPITEEDLKANQRKDTIAYVPGLVLYTKPGCGRCTTAINHLKSRKVAFTEIDLEKASVEVNMMWSGLGRQGFQKRSVLTPVIAKDGVYYADVQDLVAFLDKLVSEN